jgi:D-alanyl-D-alanine carboxypeptidase
MKKMGQKGAAFFVCAAVFCAACSAQASDEQKLARVLAALDPATKRGISPTLGASSGTRPDPDAAKEFLAELEGVLAADTDDLLRLVDKRHALPDGYAPKDLVPLVKNDAYGIGRNDLSLRSGAEKALREMARAAQKDGAYLVASSSYRSYEYQVQVYGRNVRQMGQAAADRESARPGRSQHQLGTVVDFGSITDDYAQTKAGRWLAENAAEFGWSLSFPDGYEAVTGYRWECWHYRYVGVRAARFQKKWFSDIQQFMLEFIHAWKTS